MDEVDAFIVVIFSGRDIDDSFVVTVGAVTVGTIICVEDVSDDFEVVEDGVSAFVDEINCVVDEIDAATDVKEDGVDDVVEDVNVVSGVDSVLVLIEVEEGGAVVDDNEEVVSLDDEVDILSVVRSVGVITLRDEVGEDIVAGVDTAIDTVVSSECGRVGVVVGGVVIVVTGDASEVDVTSPVDMCVGVAVVDTVGFVAVAGDV